MRIYLSLTRSIVVCVLSASVVCSGRGRSSLGTAVRVVGGSQHALSQPTPTTAAPVSEVDPSSIDEGLYSRQLYVLGRDAQRALQAATVLVVGCTGVGVELAKNVCLAGVAEISLFDPSLVSPADLATNFYLAEADAREGVLTRAEACARHLTQLNPHVRVSIVNPAEARKKENLDPEGGHSTATTGSDCGGGSGSSADFRSFSAVSSEAAASLVASGRFAVAVCVDQPLNVQLAMNDAAREVSKQKERKVENPHGCPSDSIENNEEEEKEGEEDNASTVETRKTTTCAFLSCGVRGVFGHVFCDFGDDFEVKDPNGVTPEPVLLAALSLHKSLFSPSSSSEEASSSSSEPEEGEGASSSSGAVAGASVVVEAECVYRERHGLSVGQRVKLSDLSWQKTEEGQKENAEQGTTAPTTATASAVPLEGVVVRVLSPGSVLVQLDNHGSSSSSSSSSSAILSPLFATTATTATATAAAATPVLTSGSLVRPKLDEALRMAFRSLRELLPLPAVPPHRPRKPRKADFAARALLLDSSAEPLGETGEETEEEYTDDDSDDDNDDNEAREVRQQRKEQQKQKEANKREALVREALSEALAPGGAYAAELGRYARAVEKGPPPAPMVPCEYTPPAPASSLSLSSSSSPARDRKATVHACWWKALPKWRALQLRSKRKATGEQQQQHGKRGIAPRSRVGDSARERAAEFLAILREEMGVSSGGSSSNEKKNNNDNDDAAVVPGVGVRVRMDEEAARAFAHCLSCGHGGGDVDDVDGDVGADPVVGLSPVSSVVGGVAAQEVLKAVSGVFKPIEQFWYFDACSVLPSRLPQPKQPPSTSSSRHEDKDGGDDGNTDDDGNDVYDRDEKGEEIEDEEAAHAADFFGGGGGRLGVQRALLGEHMCRELRGQRWFVVGAGAIGCELLKNLALLGVACPSNKENGGGGGASGGEGGGALVLTDMDTIERSNLNRQFLFRKTDLGKAKSEAASAAAKRINPQLKVTSLRTAVNPESEVLGGFDDAFWSSLDGVLTALDNLEARLYVDEQCVKHAKPLVDAGTLGAKGNVQVVLPHVTESYGASADPPEPATPVCTLKSFPYKIEHTIQWARELFDECFTQGPASVETLLDVAASASLAAAASSSSSPAAATAAAAALRAVAAELSSREGGGGGRGGGGDDAGSNLACLVSTYCEPMRRSFTGVNDTEGKVDDDDDDDDERMRRLVMAGAERASLEWAAASFLSSHFLEPMAALRKKHPEGCEDPDTGLPFWSGTRRRPPPPLLDDSLHGAQTDVVLAAARLHADVLTKRFLLEGDSGAVGGGGGGGGASLLTRENAAAAITSEINKEKDKVGKEEEEEEEEGEVDYEGSHGNGGGDDEIDEEGGGQQRQQDLFWRSAKGIVQHMEWRQTLKLKLNPATAVTTTALAFEKDDDSNGHIDFITAASNLRASAYGIASSDKHGTKRVAGSIVPAIATTTAVVSGLSCLELLKLAKLRVEAELKDDVADGNKRLRGTAKAKEKANYGEGAAGAEFKEGALATHRNSFLSLALPVFTFSEPVEAEEFPWGNRAFEEERDEDEVDEEVEAGDHEEMDNGVGSVVLDTKKKEFTVWDSFHVFPLVSKTVSSSSSSSLADSTTQRWRHLTLRELIGLVERAAGEGAVVRGLSCQERIVFSDLGGGGGGGEDDGGDEEDSGDENGVGLQGVSGRLPLLDTPVPNLLRSLGILTRPSKSPSTSNGDANVAARGEGEEGGEYNGRLFIDLEALVEDVEDGEPLEVPPVRYFLAPPPPPPPSN